MMGGYWVCELEPVAGECSQWLLVESASLSLSDIMPLVSATALLFAIVGVWRILRR